MSESRVVIVGATGMIGGLILRNALVLALGFPRTHLFRPGYIYPVTPRTEPNLSYRAFRALVSS
jgi:hypothetical protein